MSKLKDVPSAGLIVSEEMRRLSERPGILSSHRGGQRLRDLYVDQSVNFDASKLSTFGFKCFAGLLDDVKKAIKDGSAPDVKTAYETAYHWSYVTLAVNGCGRVHLTDKNGEMYEPGNHVATIKYLISLGVPLDMRDIAGYTALHHACIRSSVPALARALLEGGADPNWVDKFGSPPLYGAIMSKQVEAIDVLMEFGASLDIRDADNFAMGPLNFATFGPEVSAPIHKWLRRRKGEHAPMEDGKCDFCGKVPAQGDKKFARCAACQMVSYCSKECQRADWKEHKVTCKPATADNSLIFKPFYSAQADMHQFSLADTNRELLGIDTSTRYSPQTKKSAKKGHPKKPFVDASGKGFTVKVQIPMDMSAELQAFSHNVGCLVYNKTKDFQCHLRRTDGPQAFDAMVKLVREKGIGGVKAYFRAELPSEDRLVIRTSELLAAQTF